MVKTVGVKGVGHHHTKKPVPAKVFLGLLHKTWFDLAKWLSIAGASVAAIITAAAAAYKLIHG